MRTVVASLLAFVLAPLLCAQDQPTPAMPETTAPPGLDEIVKRQFGPSCELAMERSSVHMNYRVQKKEVWVNFLSGDFDGDGVMDAAIVARCKNPIAGEVEYNYKVEDPYFSVNGYGDPKITVAFSSGDPEHQNVVLMIHGAGAEGWRAATPKAKFILLNLPFDNLQLMQIRPKKKANPVAALDLVEGDSQNSTVFWNGKKYQWRDLGSQ
jgi:hypothetical protein